ncbi:UNVERIFIED_CONTAM: hypothetical protein PYX00_007541 [Menopon gallinae]|uniref:Uncharacterized protein n=1 Tax=Menopon gallinae TaxID=328185 RepID=A0AAW2HKB0_9NEOP
MIKLLLLINKMRKSFRLSEGLVQVLITKKAVECLKRRKRDVANVVDAFCHVIWSGAVVQKKRIHYGLNRLLTIEVFEFSAAPAFEGVFHVECP